MSMSGSTLIVAINALMLKRTKLAGIRQPGKNAAPVTPGGPATPEAAKASVVPANPPPNEQVAA
jgi:Cu2+-exporting ATPase